jgi:protein disulfide-isomerase A6
MGVKGFPTLKIVKPGKKTGSPMVEDYNGARESKDIVDAVVSRMTNHVKRVTDKDLEAFLADANETAKVILFTEKGTTSALLKAIAIDFLGSIKVAQIRNKEKASVELFGITKFPTVLLLPGGPEAEGIVYDGEMKKDGLIKFLSQVAAPNPDPAAAKVNVPKKKDSKKPAKKAEKAKEEFESASSSHASSEGTEQAATATDETLEEASKPTESPDPAAAAKAAAPVIVQDFAPPIPALTTGEELAKECFGPGSGTCVLAFVPAQHGEVATVALTGLAEIAHKYKNAKRQMFPFYVVPDDNIDAAGIKASLGIALDGVSIIAVNRKRSWWRQYSNGDWSHEGIENWIDAIRMGEGQKNKLPEGILAEKVPEAEAQNPIKDVPEPVAEPAAEVVEEAAEPVKDKHDEL